MDVIREALSMPVDPELARELKRSAQLHERSRKRRDMLIREAHTAGASLREIGALAGLSHVAVLKITSKDEPDFHDPRDVRRDESRRRREAARRAEVEAEES